MEQIARDAEAQRLAIDAPVISQCAIAERAKGNRHRNPANDIVDDFMARQHFQGVSAGIAGYIDCDHGRIVRQARHARGRLEARIVYRRDAVARHAARNDLVKVDHRLAEIGLPADGRSGRQRIAEQPQGTASAIAPAISDLSARDPGIRDIRSPDDRRIRSEIASPSTAPQLSCRRLESRDKRRPRQTKNAGKR